MSQHNFNHPILKSYSLFTVFLCNALGSLYGTVLYGIDPTEKYGEVIAMAGANTQRDIGDPMTPFVRSVYESMLVKGHRELIHVDTEASTSDGRIKLCFFPIYDADQMIGLFVIYTSIELMCDARLVLNQFLGFDSAIDRKNKIPDIINDENLTLTKYMLQLIQEEIDSFSVPVSRMTMDEKRQIVQQLAKKEVFYVKDSVRSVASLLEVSVPTVYRLLKQE